jgi:cephalosporin-C deacetylase
MSFNFFGHDAFYQEKYVPERGYMAEGAECPETYIFRTMIQNALMATRVLQAQPEADENRIAAMGMSQGGGMAIWLGAFSPIIRAVCADMPFFGGLKYVLQKQAYRYPLRELTDFADTIPIGAERILHTLAYFDTLNIATRCRKPTRVTCGLRDPSVRKEQATAIFEAIDAEKEFQEWDWGHDWHAEMIEGNRAFLEKHLGE